MRISQFKVLGLIAAFVMMHTSPVAADGFSAVVNGKSHHFNSTYDWNENNVGIGLEYQLNSRPNSAWKTIAMANGFRDSTDNMSYMAGAGLHRRLFESDKWAGFYIDAGLSAFMMTRDDVNDGKPFPGILPSISVGNDRAGINLSYLPKKAIEQSTGATFIDPTLSGILFLQFKVSLDQLLPST